MLHARLTVDLPREPLPRTGRITRLLLSLIADPGPEGERDRLLGDGLEILRVILSAFSTAGWRDVVTIRVGEALVYSDGQRRLDDLGEALDDVVKSGRLGRGFGMLWVVLSHEQDGQHTVAELQLDEEVVRGKASLTIDLVGRISELRVRADETPRSYQQRVDAQLAEGILENHASRASAVLNTLSMTLSRAFGSISVNVEPPELRLVAPGPLQVGRFRHLGFGPRLRPPTYRAVPKGRRSAAYEHPHVRYFYDPYHDLLCWVMLLALLEDQVAIERITVVDPDATLLFELDEFTDVPEHVTLPVPRSAVTLEEDRIVVDDSIPAVGLDAAEAGSPHAPGYGGEDFG
ncbi:MAG: hypothetical protein AB1Z98_10815 [Nannocystaceae bacterium]